MTERRAAAAREGPGVRRGGYELSREAFETLLVRLGGDREQAAEAYEQIRRRLIRLFEWRACPDAEALADETIDRVARRLAEGVEIRAENPYAYFAGVASYVFREVLRRNERERAMEAPPAADPSPLEETASGTRLACLERCLGELPAQARELVLGYYAGDGRERISTRARLAQERGVDANALRVRVHRLRQGLEGCLTRCLEERESE